MRGFCRCLPFLAVGYFWGVLVFDLAGGQLVTIASISFALVVVLSFVATTKRGQALLDIGLAADAPDEQPGPVIRSRLARWGWPLLGLAIVIGSIALLEYRQPFFFTQDDNYANAWGLPLILLGGRSLLQGTFCTWNPYQLLGTPAASRPEATLTYPLTYISYFAARYLLGNEYASVEVLSILHLVLGYIAMYVLARYLGLRPLLAMVCSLSFILSGYTLILGRSWFHYLPVAVWMPLLMLAVIRLRRGPVSWKWVLGTGLVIGMFFHSGYAPMWAYALLFFATAIGVLVTTGVLPVRRALWAAPALIFGIGVAAPLLLPQMLETRSFYDYRSGGYGEGIQPGVQSLLLPYPVKIATSDQDNFGPASWGSTNYEYMGQFYYSGTLFYAIGFLLFGCLAAYRLRKRAVGGNVWLVCAGAALLLALGTPGGLWPLLMKLPMLDKTSGPFKFLIFLNLFVILGTATVMERWLRAFRAHRVWELSAVSVVVLLLLYHVSLPLPSFYTYGDRPYPPLPKALSQLLKPEDSREVRRFAPFAPERTPARGFVSSLVLDFPTVFEVPAFGGYDPLVQLSRENLLVIQHARDDMANTLKAHGVRWILVHKLAEDTVYSGHPAQADRESQHGQEWLDVLSADMQQKLALPDMTVYELKGASPLAFPVSQPDRALPINFSGNGASVDVSEIGDGGSIVVNVLNRRWMRATADGCPLGTGVDEWGRLVTEVPAGTHTLAIRYSPPWGKGLLAGLVLIALAAALAAWIGRASVASEQNVMPGM